MDDVALAIRSCIAFLESIKTYISVLPQPRSAHFLHWSDRRHELAELAPAPAAPEPALSSAPQKCCLHLDGTLHGVSLQPRMTMFLLSHLSYSPQ